MSAWIAAALAGTVSALVTVTVVNAQSSLPGNPQSLLKMPSKLDFNSVPEISKQIAIDEKTSQKPKGPTSEPPTAPYTGPIFGASPRPGRTPVVGYSWSLE